MSEVVFEQTKIVSAQEFCDDLRQAFVSFSQIFTADFQITRLNINSGLVQTRVLYEIVGTGAGFFREQRTGFWDLVMGARTDQTSIECRAGERRRKSGAGRLRRGIPTLPRVRLEATARTQRNCSTESIIGARFWMERAGSTSMDTTGYQSVTSTATASTIFTSVSPLVCRIAYFEIEATGPSKM